VISAISSCSTDDHSCMGTQMRTNFFADLACEVSDCCSVDDVIVVHHLFCKWILFGTSFPNLHSLLGMCMTSAPAQACAVWAIALVVVPTPSVSSIVEPIPRGGKTSTLSCWVNRSGYMFRASTRRRARDHGDTFLQYSAELVADDIKARPGTQQLAHVHKQPIHDVSISCQCSVASGCAQRDRLQRDRFLRRGHLRLREGLATRLRHVVHETSTAGGTFYTLVFNNGWRPQ
jgi:hypothetical protein